MIISYLLAQTFVPIMANWLMKGHKAKKGEPEFVADAAGEEDTGTRRKCWRKKYCIPLTLNSAPLISSAPVFFVLKNRLFPFKKLIVTAYVILISGAAVWLLTSIGRDVLPKTNAGQFQVRLRAADGTRVENTERIVLRTLGGTGFIGWQRKYFYHLFICWPAPRGCFLQALFIYGWPVRRKRLFRYN